MGSQLPPLQPPSTVDWDSDAAIDNSAYQIGFNNTMEKYNLDDAMSYKKVEVLMLQWANESSDLSADDEVQKLKEVLEQKFHYHAVVRYLDVHSSRNIQLQVNKLVTDFLWDHSGPDTLLIVYYAGHGKPGLQGELKCFGRISPNVPIDGREKTYDEFVWNNTETMFRETTANVLEIFDCCYAGTLSLTRGEPSFFEFLAATGARQTTKRPGPQSFTSALIYALERLLESQPEGRFTTAELLKVIKHQAPDFPKDQVPVLSDREGNNNQGRIILHPLEKEKRKGPEVHQTARSTLKDEKSGPEAMDPVLEQFNRHVYTLHCAFPRKPSVEDITALTSPTMEYIQRNRLNVKLQFGGVQHTATRRAVQGFRQSCKRRQSGSPVNNSPDHQSPKMRLYSRNVLHIRTPPSSNFKSFKSPVTLNTKISDSSEAGQFEEHEKPRLRAAFPAFLALALLPLWDRMFEILRFLFLTVSTSKGSSEDAENATCALT